MKKIFVGTLILLCLFTVACGKKSSEGWETVLSNQAIDLDDEKINIFNEAKSNYTSLNLEAVALLGKQLVSGINYMFLAKGYQDDIGKATYKIVIVYHDLEGNNTITKVTDFDYTKYVNEQILPTDEQLVGGWQVESTGRPYDLADEKVQEIFNQATSTLAGISYKPLIVVGKKEASGINYAILCYGSATVPDAKENIYLVTLYQDLNGTSEIVGNSYIDLAEYNK